jgi:hypothetical protein
MTSQNLTILTTQEQRPAAAFDLFSIIAGSNSGLERYSFLTNATFAGGSSLLFTIYLKFRSAVMKAEGSFISFCEAFQSYTFGFFDLSESISL